jgi:hypothetical protein
MLGYVSKGSAGMASTVGSWISGVLIERMMHQWVRDEFILTDIPHQILELV